MKTWRDVNAIYQIYPRSFMDANGDGVGDLRGVIDRLEYIKGTEESLGIDAIWFSPIFPSPQADMGYDVSDYCDIDPLFGTLEDFKELVEKAHKKDIKVMLDFVPNHSSHEHPWFIESKKNKNGPYGDYYTWRDAKPDGSLPNNWQSIFGGPAWTWDEVRQQYYLHTFLKEQPDLNWDNPAVRREMQNVVRFWMELGVDGIRADAVRGLSKDPELGDDPINEKWNGKQTDLNKFGSLIHTHSRFWKNLFPYLREMTDVIAEFDDRIMIFEDYPDEHFSTKEQYLGFYGINPKVSMPFNFDGLHAQFDATSFRNFVTEFQGMLNPDEHTPVYCFSNHDKPRIVSRMGGQEQARLVALLQLTLPGLPTVYYGDELGMPNTPIRHDEIRDLSAFSSGDDSVGRDPCRTPMQWDTSEHAGFSNIKPWLPIGPTLLTSNVKTQTEERDSLLALYQRLLALRARHEILRHGTYEVLDEFGSNAFIFSRWHEGAHVYVALNFDSRPLSVKLPHKGRILCCTHPVDYPTIADDGTVLLRPYEGVLVECSEHPLSITSRTES
jgi:alpha-glucosidase